VGTCAIVKIPPLVLPLLALVASVPLDARVETPLNAGWLFHRGEVTGGEAAALDVRDWKPVTLPHTFNDGDGESGGGYYRGPAWYRRVLVVKQPAAGRAFLDFEGAALAADIYVNGVHLARHEGGFARFRVDATDALKPGPNLIAVRTDNGSLPHVAPRGGDFTLFGGLYRPVSLIETGDVHFDLMDHGGPGLYVSLRMLDRRAASLSVRARLTNDGARPAELILSVEARDRSGHRAGLATRRVTLPPHATSDVALPLGIANPHRWDGARDPYLYRLVGRVEQNKAFADTVEVPLGIRTIHFDARRGFLLNGRPYALHGVDYFHPERPGVGTAVTDEQVDQDMRILGALGVTGLRLVHFQHPQRVYDDADRMGLPLWTEIPLNGAIGDGARFRANVEEQMRELISQNYNHPSVVIWGVGNEVYATDPAVADTIRAVHQIAKAEDPSRPTAYAHCCQADDDPKAMITDLIAFNRYMGWYSDEGAGIGAWADGYHRLHPTRPFLVSEYGAGASIRQQQVPPPVHNAPTGGWHPEQAQTAYHISNWDKLRTRSYLSGSFVWVAFDLPSDGRREGDRPGINDKGLVTYDRQTRKDAYFWYQANWSSLPVLHLLDKRASRREASPVPVELVTNATEVTLMVNGEWIARQKVIGHHALFPAVQLRPGPNLVRIEAMHAGQKLSDEAVWTLRQPSPRGVDKIPAEPEPSG
jgi:beta-galactosidase